MLAFLVILQKKEMETEPHIATITFLSQLNFRCLSYREIVHLKSVCKLQARISRPSHIRERMRDLPTASAFLITCRAECVKDQRSTSLHQARNSFAVRCSLKTYCMVYNVFNLFPGHIIRPVLRPVTVQESTRNLDDHSLSLSSFLFYPFSSSGA